MIRRRCAGSGCAVLILGLLGATAVASETDDRNVADSFDRMTVIGTPDGARLAAGAASFVSPEELEAFRHTDIHRVLRQVPGVYIVEEEGLGLRPNIGIRGSGTDRSARITITEDGVLAAPAPYAAPAAYYFPTLQRMSAVEIRKGSASVRSGPRTTGGAINLVSTPIPDAPLLGHGALSVGQQGTVLGHAHVGGRTGHWGWLLEGVRQQSDGFKRIDGGGDAGYTLDNYLGKLRYHTDPAGPWYQEVEFKLGRTDQDSDETYLGLTDADFAARPNRRYAASRRDNLSARHDLMELRHYLSVTDRIDVTSAVYRNKFARNWYKLHDVDGQSLADVLADPATFADEYAWLTGTTSPDGVLRLRNNNRRYYSEGVQTIVGWTSPSGGGIGHAVEFGVRYHRDEEDRFQDDDRYRMEDGTLVLTEDGAPGSQSNRVGEASALSLYLQNEIRWGAWIVTPGLRYERIDLDRTTWATDDPGRDAAPTDTHGARVSEVIPGLGAVYRFDNHWTMLASVHKGFSPPAPGSDSRAERSINYESGLRFRDGAFHAEAIGFYNDYDNLVGTCTASTGGGCNTGDQFDGGEVRMRGLELSSGYAYALPNGLTLPLRVSYTYTDAQFRTGFDSAFSEWGSVQRGDRLPYLPAQQGQAITGIEAAHWNLTLSAAYVSRMRARPGRGDVDPGDRIDAHWLFDLAGEWRLTEQFSVFARLENLLDETYIAARRPAGARPGRPRTGLLGLKVAL